MAVARIPEEHPLTFLLQTECLSQHGAPLHPRLGALNSRHVFLTALEAARPKSGSGCAMVSLPGLERTACSPPSHARALVDLPVFIRTLTPPRSPPPIASSNPNYLLNAPPHSMTTLGIRASTREFWEGDDCTETPRGTPLPKATRSPLFC